MKFVPSYLTLLFLGSSLAHGFPILSASSLDWLTIPGDYDYLADHQTGQISGDIVGSYADPGFFTSFIQGETDDHLAFRVRLDGPGGTNTRPVFDRFLWVGMDADFNGSLDAFLGVNRQGNNNLLQLYAPGNGANTSPSTTTISNTPYFSTSLVSTNYHYRPVDTTLDGATSNDLGLNVNDYYLSFAMPLGQIAGFLATRNIAYDEFTPVRYVLATSTQGNSLNQDLGGVAGSINSSLTWEALGGFSPPATAVSGVIPEPSTVLLGAMSALLWFPRRRVS